MSRIIYTKTVYEYCYYCKNEHEVGANCPHLEEHRAIHKAVFPELKLVKKPWWKFWGEDG